MRKIFYFLMAMPLIMALNSCNDAGNTDDTPVDPVTWGKIEGNLNELWEKQSQQSFATSDNIAAQIALPILIDMLNTTPEAEAYLFNADKSYAQYWSSEQPNDEETGMFKEAGTYVLNERNLTLSFTNGESGLAETSEYKIVSLSATQLVLYKDLLGIWGTLTMFIPEAFRQYTPKSAYQIITYSKYVASAE
ncbi:MAG: lipocalin family protein [Dysgonamonadaceae bacterium]|jgi:hypothetical protein|nr:lipocalin family protein [Dysgonamonadaceae bacterium]